MVLVEYGIRRKNSTQLIEKTRCIGKIFLIRSVCEFVILIHHKISELLINSLWQSEKWVFVFFFLLFSSFIQILFLLSIIQYKSSRMSLLVHSRITVKRKSRELFFVWNNLTSGFNNNFMNLWPMSSKTTGYNEVEKYNFLSNQMKYRRCH